MPYIYKQSEEMKELKKMSNKSRKLSREVSSGAHTMTQTTTAGANSVTQKRRVISASNHGRIGRNNTRNVSTSFNKTQKMAQQDFHSNLRSNLDLSDQLNDSVIRASQEMRLINDKEEVDANLVKDLLDADEEIPEQDLPKDSKGHHRVVSD